MSRAHRKLIPFSCLWMALCVLPASLDAQKTGENIYSQSGIISNLNNGPEVVRYIPIKVPRLGQKYQVKINFLKVETSAAAVDAYLNALAEQAKARGETPSPSRWSDLRARLMEVTSQADFEVFDAAGYSVGKASDLGITTFFRGVKFTASSYEYKVKLRCTSGAGAYHLTLEWY